MSSFHWSIVTLWLRDRCWLFTGDYLLFLHCHHHSRSTLTFLIIVAIEPLRRFLHRRHAHLIRHFVSHLALNSLTSKTVGLNNAVIAD